MSLFSGIQCASSRTSSLFELYTVKLSSLPALRTYKYGVKNAKKPSPENELKALSGFDDQNFTHNLGITLRNPKLLLKGLKYFGREIKRYVKEETDSIKQSFNYRLDELNGRIDILHKFENSEDLKGFQVYTDSTFSCGYSSASLKITDEETGLFSGHICEDRPKDGNVTVSGFCTMLCPKQELAFFRARRYRWDQYTHLVLKIRGDGRTYLVLLQVPENLKECAHFQYAQPLHTRGGPYWQIVKMPFSHFFFMKKGHIPSRGSSAKVILTRILRMGISAAGYEGPFRLEIDYIGLTYENLHKRTSPYEEYRV